MSFIKLFFNILKSHKINFILPMAIVLIFSIIMLKSMTGDTSEYNPNVYIIDNDNTEFSQKLVEEISKYSVVENYKDNVDIEEELMVSYINCYIEIPKGFTENFNKYKDIKEGKFKFQDRIIIKAIENSNSKIFISEKINKFLNAELNDTEVDEDFIKLEISSALSNDDTTMKITIISYAAYGILYGVPSIIGTFIMLIRKKDIKDRYFCGPITTRNYLVQITLVSILLMIVFCLILAIFIMNILFSMPFDKVWLLNFINMINLGIFALGLGLLCGILTRNIQALSGTCTGISLALAFLGGIFVPIEIFSNTMKTVAKYTPGYWYGHIATTLNSNVANFNMNEILTSFGMQYIFIAIILVIVAIVNKKKK